MKVLYYVANYHRFAGAQRSLALLLAHVGEWGIEPLVVTAGEGVCTARLRELGLDVRVMAPPNALRGFGGALQRAGLVRRTALFAGAVLPYSLGLAALMREEGVRVAHFNDSRALLLGGPAAHLAGVPTVWHVRGDVSALGRAYTLPCGWMADRIILVADGVRTGVPRRFREKCRVVYNGADPVILSAEAPRRGELLCSLEPPMSDGVLVLVTASLIPLKGLHHALEALRVLRGQDPEAADLVRLVTLGDRADESYARILDDRVRELRLANVRFAGWNADPSCWYRAADIVLLPTVESELLEIDGVVRKVSGGEGLPRSVLEAMSFGRAVIATAVGGVPELIEHERSGLVVPPSAPQAMAAALRRLVRGPEERNRLGVAARERVLERFSAASMTQGVVEVYRELTDGIRASSRSSSASHLRWSSG